MQIVIDVDEKTVAHIRKQYENKVYGIWDNDASIVQKAIYNAKELPKGHGRLIDADAVLSKIESEYERAEVAMWLYSVAAIVESDKEVDE